MRAEPLLEPITAGQDLFNLLEIAFQDGKLRAYSYTVASPAQFCSTCKERAYWLVIPSDGTGSEGEDSELAEFGGFGFCRDCAVDHVTYEFNKEKKPGDPGAAFFWIGEG